MKKILLIDDDRDDTELFREALQDVSPASGFQGFDDGNEAIRALTTQRVPLPDLIFLDINMPAVSGWECLRRFKKTEALAAIPVIMYTTSTLPREKEIAQDLGAAGFITKPTDFKMLKRIVQTILHAPSEQLSQALLKLQG